ncbi:MAG: transposase [Deltaproteobacteria bacterium]|nr:transposase [Deltaproteobacteria bacterium]
MGLTAEQVLGCGILKQHRNLTYEGLAFHLEDSESFRAFSRLDLGQYPSGSTLQENIKALKEETWEQINWLVTGYGQKEVLENGRNVRLDSTGVRFKSILGLEKMKKFYGYIALFFPWAKTARNCDCHGLSR